MADQMERVFILGLLTGMWLDRFVVWWDMALQTNNIQATKNLEPNEIVSLCEPLCKAARYSDIEGPDIEWLKSTVIDGEFDRIHVLEHFDLDLASHKDRDFGDFLLSIVDFGDIVTLFVFVLMAYMIMESASSVTTVWTFHTAFLGLFLGIFLQRVAALWDNQNIYWDLVLLTNNLHPNEVVSLCRPLCQPVRNSVRVAGGKDIITLFGTALLIQGLPWLILALGILMGILDSIFVLYMIYLCFQ